MIDLDALIAQAREALASEPPVTKYVSVPGRKELIGVQFTPISGSEWRALAAQHLPRPRSFLDQNLGYNLDAVTREFPNFVIVDGDGVDNLKRVDEEGNVRYAWPDIFDKLEDPAIEILAQALYEVHVSLPLQRMVKAGKASRAARAKKPRSPGISASPSGN